MKVQIIPYPPPPREVVVTMSEEEAQRLYKELGSVSGTGTMMYRLYQALSTADIR